jgi:hypothetical protein
MFEDIKGVIGIRKSKKDKQHNGQKNSFKIQSEKRIIIYRQNRYHYHTYTWQKIDQRKGNKTKPIKHYSEKLEIKPHERHRNSKVNSCVLEGPAVPTPLEAPVELFILSVQWFVINSREYRRANQKWTIHRNWQHGVHKPKTNKTKTQHNMCWTPLRTHKHK